MLRRREDGDREPIGMGRAHHAGPRATRGLWSFPEEVRPVRDREGCRDIGSGRGSRGSRRRAVIEPGGHARTIGCSSEPFFDGTRRFARGVNAGAHLRGVAHDDHASPLGTALTRPCIHPDPCAIVGGRACVNRRPLVCRATDFFSDVDANGLQTRVFGRRTGGGPVGDRKNARFLWPTRLLA